MIGKSSLLAMGAAAWVAGCSPVDATLDEPDLDNNRMLAQPRYDAYEKNDFFDDGMAMRVPPEGTVPWRHRHPRSSEPPAVTGALLARGRDAFEVFCGACHGVDGYGESVVAENMTLLPPPSLHTERVRAHDVDEIHRIATRGYGLMPGYRAQLDHDDRWAVAHYVKALQLSRHLEVAALPDGLRRKLAEELP
ncbi:MAG: c-type cytochrome [Myxococcota bacterium]